MSKQQIEQQSFTPEDEQEINDRVEEWEKKYGSLDRTTRMLEQLRESHSTGVDNLCKLGQQGEQMNRVNKLTEEQETYIKGLGKYKKFNKYMKRFSKKDKNEKNEGEDRKNQELHNERQNDEKEKRERLAQEHLQKQKEDQESGNPFSNTTTTSTTTPKSPKEQYMNEEERFEKKGLSRLWKNDPLNDKDKTQINYAMENQAVPIHRLSDEGVKDNVFVQRSTWIKKQDAQLDEMQDILSDLKNIGMATQTELQTQSLKLDDIGQSMDKGSDFSLRKKSKRKIEKEQKKKEKAEKEKTKKEEKTRQDIDKKIKEENGVGVSSK
ncbi:hypothetical protein DICPUDRAFT_98856 [Dictyostelium purpureum]|uniref:t-SNARE coiled-coil homology domain-containing protein n=1 Tax=Dictyostelium purpureum TaxID=5786 RepID=F0ZU48_DICPU|nr:uncharacterized protein DICPUDRAFT_98856 [Dictyostelium purpureum]EGC32523.1 hypothetical protein DICPUDRAFT_98856 [Dictyostelium purpureum]|eukprot:XP_003290935.1 hypothetical protein DICPUDRAFT_98856 [Dictyostelium purpureum]